MIDGIKKCKEEIADLGIHVDLKLCPDFDAKAQLLIINQAIEEGLEKNYPMALLYMLKPDCGKLLLFSPDF